VYDARYQQISALVQHVPSLAGDLPRLPLAFRHISTFTWPSGAVNAQVANIAAIIIVLIIVIIVVVVLVIIIIIIIVVFHVVFQRVPGPLLSPPPPPLPPPAAIDP